MHYEIRKLTFTGTIKEAFALYKDNFAPMFLISLIASIPIALLPQLPQQITKETLEVFLASLLTNLPFILILKAFSTILFIRYLTNRYLDRQETVQQHLKNAIPLFLPTLGLLIAVYTLIWVGVLVYVIPGIYLFLCLSVAVESMILERRGIIDAIKRSFFLTEGVKLEILGYGAMILAIYLGTSLLGGELGVIMQSMQLDTKIQHLIMHLLAVLITPLNFCLFILVYFNLRVLKEGLNSHQLTHQLAPPGESQPPGSDS